MKLSKSLLTAIAIGITSAATLSSCSVDIVNIDPEQGHEIENVCETEKGGGDDCNCPACGLG